jgi:hypothetical protein
MNPTNQIQTNNDVINIINIKKTIVFKVMGSDNTNTIEVINLPKSYRELLDLLKTINHSIHYSQNNITFCIDGKPFTQTCTSIIYPSTKNNKYFIVIFIKPKQLNQTHNGWGKNVHSTVEGYVTPDSKTTFIPQNRLGEDTGVTLIVPSGTTLRDKNGNPIKISVQTVNGPSSFKIKGKTFHNVTRD